MYFVILSNYVTSIPDSKQLIIYSSNWTAGVLLSAKTLKIVLKCFFIPSNRIIYQQLKKIII